MHFVNHRVRLVVPPISRFRRNAALVSYLGGGEPRAGDGAIVPDASTRMRMAEDLGRCRGAVVMHPGTSVDTGYKRWPAERYAEVARALFIETGMPCVVSSGPGQEEHALADAVVAASGSAARHAPRTCDARELAAVYASCSVFIGSDSGPLHIASAVGTPVVQLMGPTHPVENECNPATPWRRVRVPMPCSPCRRGCATADCMQEILPEQVVAAARELFGKATPLARRAQ
jgi:ADP-heptose:LPS heptosyltransferase